VQVRLKADPLEIPEALQRILGLHRRARHRDAGGEELGREHRAALEDQRGGEVTRRQVHPDQVFGDLPRAPVLLKQRPRAHDGRDRLEVRIRRKIGRPPPRRPEAALPRHEAERLVGEALDQDRLQHPDRGDGADELGQVLRRRRGPGPAALHVAEDRPSSRQGQQLEAALAEPRRGRQAPGRVQGRSGGLHGRGGEVSPPHRSTHGAHPDQLQGVARAEAVAMPGNHATPRPGPVHPFTCTCSRVQVHVYGVAKGTPMAPGPDRAWSGTGGEVSPPRRRTHPTGSKASPRER